MHLIFGCERIKQRDLLEGVHPMGNLIQIVADVAQKVRKALNLGTNVHGHQVFFVHVGQGRGLQKLGRSQSVFLGVASQTVCLRLRESAIDPDRPVK